MFYGFKQWAGVLVLSTMIALPFPAVAQVEISDEAKLLVACAGSFNALADLVVSTRLAENAAAVTDRTVDQLRREGLSEEDIDRLLDASYDDERSNFLWQGAVSQDSNRCLAAL